ncbi:MAG: hypothetical protein ABFD79_04675 [Phycisphaerales bacterium]
MNENKEPTCQQQLDAFFKAYPNPNLQNEVNGFVTRYKIPMKGKSGGWAGGIVYALSNLYKSPCGIRGVLNKECEDSFNVSMDTIYRRAYQISKLLVINWGSRN